MQRNICFCSKISTTTYRQHKQQANLTQLADRIANWFIDVNEKAINEKVEICFQYWQHKNYPPANVFNVALLF